MNAITQFYSVDMIRTSEGVLKFEGDVAAQLIVVDHREGQLLVTNPSQPLDGPYRIKDFFKTRKPVRLERIQYTILGWAGGKKIHHQAYHHDFKIPTYLGSSWGIIPSKGPLFIPYQLDTLLDTHDQFPKITAIQFIA